MTIETVPLSSLIAPKGNPRKTTDAALIDGLAASIRSEGLLQNLVVRPAKDGKYRVVAGSRRVRALKLLERQGNIESDWPVPVEVRADVSAADALRIATAENIQREPLDPIDEADAFARLAQKGADLKGIASRMGVSPITVRRRLALAGLCPEVKAAVRSGDITLGMAEALTLASDERQRLVLQLLEEGHSYDREDIREMFLGEKPSAAVSIFPLEEYTGTLTRDLFGEAEATFFDDVDQFLVLQEKAVEALVERHRAEAAWVDITRAYQLPSWQYRTAEEDEPAGVVINFAPSGRVEVREGLARHPVSETVVTAAQRPADTPAPHSRPEYSQPLIRYIGAHKSLAVLAALLGRPRVAKEVAAVMLLHEQGGGNRVHRELHPAFEHFSADESKPKAYKAVLAEARRLVTHLGYRPPEDTDGDGEYHRLDWDHSAIEVYEAVRALEDDVLDALLVFLPLLSFGQVSIDALETGETLFNRVAQDLGVDMVEWWRPDEVFLTGRRRDQLQTIAVESGASVGLGPLDTYKKSELVRALTRYFARCASVEEPRDDFERQGREWLPDVMRFAANEPT